MSVDPNSSNNISDLISIEGLAIAKFSRSVFKEMQRGKITAANCTCSVWENFNETIGKLTVWNDHFKKNREDKDNFIVFNRSYNQDVESKYRINSLSEIKEIVERG